MMFELGGNLVSGCRKPVLPGVNTLFYIVSDDIPSVSYRQIYPDRVRSGGCCDKTGFPEGNRINGKTIFELPDRLVSIAVFFVWALVFPECRHTAEGRDDAESSPLPGPAKNVKHFLWVVAQRGGGWNPTGCRKARRAKCVL